MREGLKSQEVRRARAGPPLSKQKPVSQSVSQNLNKLGLLKLTASELKVQKVDFLITQKQSSQNSWAGEQPQS